MGGWPSPLMRKSINHRNSVKITCFSPVKSPSSTSNSSNFPHWIDEVHVHHENHHIFPMKITIFCWWTLTPIHHHSHLRARPHRPRRWHHPGIRGQWRAAPTPGAAKIRIFSGKKWWYHRGLLWVCNVDIHPSRIRLYQKIGVNWDVCGFNQGKCGFRCEQWQFTYKNSEIDYITNYEDWSYNWIYS